MQQIPNYGDERQISFCAAPIGTADTLVAFDGLSGVHPGAVETVERWAELNGCALVPEIGRPLDLPGIQETMVRRYVSCDPGGSAELWTMHGGGHGAGTGAQVGRHILDYLLAHPKRPAPDAAFTITLEEDLVPLEAMFDASASSAPEGAEIARYLWDFGDGGKAEGIRSTHRYAQPGRYVVALTLRVVTGDDRVSAPERRTVQALCSPADVTPWRAIDVGDPVFPGAAALESPGGQSSLRLCAGGEGIGGTADEFFFAFQRVTGDFRLSARVGELSGGAVRPAIGVTMRESEEDRASFAGSFLELQATGGARFRLRYRSERAGTASARRGETIAESSAWLRIERRRGTVTAFSSLDGVAWARIRDVDVALPETVLVGVAAAGGDRPDHVVAFEPFHAVVSAIEFRSLEGASFLRGDCGSDGAVDVTDATCALDWLFAGGPAPACLAALDSNGDGRADIADPVAVLSYLFGGGPAPAAPFPECGPGPLRAVAALGCAGPPECP